MQVLTKLCILDLQQTAPIVSWNIAPATGMPYKCREGDIVPLPRYFFKVCSKFGSCHLGEVSHTRRLTFGQTSI